MSCSECEIEAPHVGFNLSLEAGASDWHSQAELGNQVKGGYSKLQ